jgi:hypothetical protein
VESDRWKGEERKDGERREYLAMINLPKVIELGESDEVISEHGELSVGAGGGVDGDVLEGFDLNDAEVKNRVREAYK